MLVTRAVRDAAEFAGMPGDPDDFALVVGNLWESGESRPEWCFVLTDRGRRIGRVGYRTAPTTTDPRWLGSLPPEELCIFGLELPWEGDHLTAGRLLLSESAASIAGQVPEVLEVRVNNELHSHPPARRALAEALGMDIFQEKQGFTWVDGGTPVVVDGRLTFRSVEETGEDTYRAVMAACGAGTLDRNDRYYWEGCGPENWASQMLVYLADEDAAMWLLGYRGSEEVGYVAVARDEDLDSTIVHVGVVPPQRGNGYINDLLLAGTAAAQRAGVDSMLSDVDVLNGPMLRAMARAGHRPDRRPWHSWVYRSPLRQLGT